ncbi:hypothetical protein [Saccharicrinis fermentans]|uniref:Uncharacterized protein n=1 Tax=Saccharicrinis fermentans DSM 9555 = JCM 21142 TaxID=869213 RepID=W7YU45_9BACT|nr:hypothetical protein [Saccharicrinis fermentans]GAF05974.1 hypothetical protein JCM21142_134739 [Saccharicrinis fermentans DSM 9555 = JCM 21142]
MENSRGPNGMDVHYIFKLMETSTNRCSVYLKQVLSTVVEIERIELCYPSVWSVFALKTTFKLHKKWKALFPILFLPDKTTTNYKATYVNRSKLNLLGIIFSINASKQIELKSYACDNVSLLLQVLLFLHFNDQGVHPDGFIESPTATYLRVKLGPSYSEGQVIDFMDLLFDQYKHTHISAKSFRRLFRCFGPCTEDIANQAFDYYGESKDCFKAWTKAVEEYLIGVLNIDKNVSKRIASLLLSVH